MLLQELAQAHESFAFTAALFALLLVVVVAVVLYVVRRKSPRLAEAVAPPEPLPLTAEGPPDVGPQLYLHGIRMRAAVVVLAPVGRGSRLPPVEELPDLLDQATPGLARVLTSHAGRVKLWPPQLSVQGFAQAFFVHFRLPGDRGKGTPWCVVAGKFEAGGRPLLLGLALSAAAPNNLSQIVVQHEGEWPRLLEVREAQ